MRKTLVIFLVICFGITGFDPLVMPWPNTGNASLAATEQAEATSGGVYFSPSQLDNLVAPIALYPDPLLAQVLVAATFADQILGAAQWVSGHNDPYSIDSQPWDVSVKAVAHYPSVLYMMRDKIDWTTSLGQAYVSQSTDVMTSVQRLRVMARSAGNLVTTPQQQVIYEGGYVRIVPYQPQYIYVPAYDPAIIYYPRPVGAVVVAGLITFGVGFAIGAWLNNDCDWHGHRVFYHGWVGGGWIARSRTNVHITNVYVNNTYRNVNINRTVVNRRVDYTHLNSYNSVHRNVDYNKVSQHPGGNEYNRPHGNTTVSGSEGRHVGEPTTSTHKTGQPVTSTNKTVQPVTSTHKTSQPVTSTNKTVQPTTSMHKDVRPTTSTHKTVEPSTLKPKPVNSATSTHKDVKPVTPAHKDVKPVTPAHKDVKPVTPTHKTVQPTEKKK